MKLPVVTLLAVTHLFAGAAGFGAGVYILPILVAPPTPTEAVIEAISSKARYTARFRRDLKGSDMLHWGMGTVSIGSKYITHTGALAPGPDYKLYLSPEFVETEADFNRLKSAMVRVGDVRTFDNFVVDVPTGVDPEKFKSVIVWCESFGQFITAARYRT